MQWQTVESSQIAEVGFEEPDTLGIRFKGNGRFPASEYHYSNVPDHVYGALVAAKSVGKFFEANIKSSPETYPYRKMGTVEIPGAVTVEIGGPGTALAKIDAITVADMFTPGFMDPILQAVRGEVMAQAAKLDISTEPNRKALAALAYRVAKSKTFIEQQRKGFVAAEKKRLQTIDAEGTRIWTILEGIQKECRQPLTEWEDAEKNRVKRLEDALSELRQAGPGTIAMFDSLTVESMEDRLREIKADATDWQEFTALAKGAKVEAVETITGAIERKKKAEADRKELERLRVASAEWERQGSIEAAVEAERFRVAAEEKAAQDAADRRAQDAALRKAIHNESAQALVRESHIDYEAAIEVIAAISMGTIPYITINY